MVGSDLGIVGYVASSQGPAGGDKKGLVVEPHERAEETVCALALGYARIGPEDGLSHTGAVEDRRVVEHDHVLQDAVGTHRTRCVKDTIRQLRVLEDRLLLC